MSTEDPTPPPPRCPDCGAAGAARFCPQCGQKQGTGIPGALSYLHEVVNHYVALDGKLWRTLWLLLVRPGMLVTEYIAGRRQRYIGPLKLYLTFSVIFFVLASLTPAAEVRVAVALDPGSKEARELEQALEQMPQGLRQAVERTLAEAERNTAQPARTAREIGDRLQAQAPRAMFLLLPAFAGLSLFAFRRRPQHYAVHLMLALHAHAVAFLLLILRLALPAAIGGKLVLVLPLWLLFAFRHLFGGRWWALAARAGFVSASYALLLVAAIAAGVLLFAATPA
ncbi:MAG: DUF3667 domain-containing protein [Gammaproteobacteria bacterium]|jgi:hypothetical protein|nr:DUF3667 domain-containing protein [Gammaproteobacteria bacterium]MBP6479650.1 DUF3667 domain-containing protein [Pseudomonadales bacterium]MBP7910483.1 DUF3667 domain-containing protein [Pseudomonadales bacterium]